MNDPMTIHILWHGSVWCERVDLRGVPSTWPSDQRWVGADTVIASVTMAPPQAPHGVNCEACLAGFADFLEHALKFVQIDYAKRAGTFAWALAQNRPMRRPAWLKHPPVDSDKAGATVFAALKDAFWVWCRPLVKSEREARWIMMTTGEPTSLTRDDYLATDWEVL